MDSLKISNQELTISDEFKSLISELSYEEKKLLEESIKKDGCLSPIVIWSNKNIVVDGHNRYEICKKNNIEFNTIKLEFLSENDAKYWIIKNQFSRRNLSKYQRCLLALKLESIIRAKARENQLSGLMQTTVHQISDEREEQEAINTNVELAKLADVSHDTIHKVRTIERFVDDKTKNDLLNEEKSIGGVYKNFMNKINKASNVITKKLQENTEKPNVLCADYFLLKDVPKHTLIHFISEDSTVFVWATVENLALAFSKIKKAGFNYVTSIVWDRGEEKSPIFLIITSIGSPQISKQLLVPIYRENSNDETKNSWWYNELIKKMFSDKDIINDFCS